MKKILTFALLALLTAVNSQAEEQLTRYYFYHAGELPTSEADCVDYRLDTNAAVSMAFAGFYPDWNGWQYVPTMNRNTEQEALWLNSQYGEYWGASLSSAEPIRLKGIEEGCTLHLRLKTNSPNTIKFALNKGNQEVAFYDLTAASTTYTTVRDGETWNDVALPLSIFSGITAADYDDAFTGTFFSIAGTGQTVPGEGGATIFVAFEDIYIEGMLDLVELPKEPLELSEALTLDENKAYTTLHLTTPAASLTLADGISVTADELTVDLDEAGHAPQIILGEGAKLTANSYVVRRNVKAGQWNLLASPAPFTVSDVTAEGTTLTKKRHTSVKHIDYDADGNSIWIAADETDIIYPSADRERQQEESYAIAVKADNDATVVVRGKKTVLTGKDYQITNVWQDGEPNTHNFNLISQPYTSDYSGIFRSDDVEDSDPDAANGVITYEYHPETDLYQPHLLIDETPVYKPYTGFFTQSYANLSAPRKAVKASPAEAPRLSISLNDDQVTFVEIEGSTEGFDQNVDAVKLFGFNAATQAIYALVQDEVMTAVSALPSLENASLRIGVKVPEAGTYTLTYHGAPGYHLTLHEASTKKDVDLHDGDTFDFEASFGGPLNYRFTAEYAADQNPDGTTDGISLASTTTQTATGNIYSIHGYKMSDRQTLPKGTYIVDGKKTLVR